MANREQIVKLNSETPPDGKALTKRMLNVQFISQPTHGDTFRLGPCIGGVSGVKPREWNNYRFVSTADPSLYDAGFRQVILRADVSATTATCSAMIAIQGTIDGYQATPALTAGSSTDITVSGTEPGMDIQIIFDNNGNNGNVVVTELNEFVAGKIIPEGVLSHITSAGNIVFVRDPAELTRQQLINPPKKN